MWWGGTPFLSWLGGVGYFSPGWEGGTQDRGTYPCLGLGYPLPWTRVPPPRDLGPVTGYPPPEWTWDQSLGYPPGKDIGPVEVLWDGNGIILPGCGQTYTCENSTFSILWMWVITNRVTSEWGCNPFWTDSFLFNEIYVASVIAALTLKLSVNGPLHGWIGGRGD